MDPEAPTGDDDSAARARETIARQREEIDDLRRRLGDERFAEDLREAMVLAASAGTIGSPVDHARLLEMIVETAAHVISARAAALLLVDEAARELTFEVAFGPKAEEVKRFRVPLGHGIAGLVAVSGQPMAVSGAESDAIEAQEVSEGVGYEPESILCVPLFYGDRVIGVLELLDKEGAPSFGAEDMELLGLFANQAAVAIELSRTYRNLGPLIGEVIASLRGAAEHEREGLLQRSEGFAARVEEEPSYAEVMELAGLVQEIAWRGDEELEACRTILRSFAQYLRTRPQPLGDVGLGS